MTAGSDAATFCGLPHTSPETVAVAYESILPPFIMAVSHAASCGGS